MFAAPIWFSALLQISTTDAMSFPQRNGQPISELAYLG
jgi:hypothetical protein